MLKEREFNIDVVRGKLVFSELNAIYDALYTHPSSFRPAGQWRGVELTIRLLRETGLRVKHAFYVEFRDIDLKVKETTYGRCGGVITFGRIRREYQKESKQMPSAKIQMPISPLFAKRIEEYKDIFGVQEDDRLCYQGYKQFSQQMQALRSFVNVAEYPGLIYTEKTTGNLFRKAYATLIVNIQTNDPWLLTELTGDSFTRLKKNYVSDGMRAEYMAMGIDTYEDIVLKVFNQEGMDEARRI